MNHRLSESSLNSLNTRRVGGFLPLFVQTDESRLLKERTQRGGCFRSGDGPRFHKSSLDSATMRGALELLAAVCVAERLGTVQGSEA